MKKRSFLKFLFVGLLTMAAGEFQITFLILQKGIGAYIFLLVVYAVLITIFYFLGNFIDKRCSLKSADLVYYVLAGFVGLMLEWFVFGTAPWLQPHAIQAGMFAWWGAVFLMPRIFTTPVDAVVRSVRRGTATTLFVYSFITILLVTISPQSLRATVSGNLIALSFLILNFQFVPFIARNGISKRALYIFMWVLVFLAIINFVI